MSFREKRAWITLAALALALIVFWYHIPPSRMLQPTSNLWVLHTVLLTLTTFVVIQIVASIVMRIRSPREARTPKDERERLIELKSIEIAWYTFASMSLGGIFVTTHFGANVVGIGFVVLFSFVLAQIVNYAMRIIYYRRGF